MMKIVAVLLVAACMSGALFPANSQAVKKQKYLALGDSYTIGESVDVLLKFPVQLIVRLNYEKIELDPKSLPKPAGQLMNYWRQLKKRLRPMILIW
jgi:hypothetical protein